MTSSPVVQQLLPLAYSPGQQFEDFVGGENARVVGALQQWLAADNSRIFYLHGRSGCGKSHLLHASHICWHGAGRQVALIDLTNADERQPEILQAVYNLDLVCLDAMDSICGNPDWETALFNLINECQPGKSRILVAASQSPDDLGLDLPDLRSRLSWDLIFRLKSLGDEEKLRVLIAHAARLGLRLNATSAEYLMAHYSRNLKSLVSFLELLNRQALQEKRNPGIALIKKLIQAQRE